jgi:hypothetical protein
MTIDTVVELKKIGRKTATIQVVGTTPLITNKFSEKSKQQMLDNMNKKGTRKKKGPKEPEVEYENSIYRLPDGRPGFPAVGFKAAMIGACRFFDQKALPMTKAKISLFVYGEGPEQLIAIDGEPEMREDAVRVGMSQTDLRYRAMFWPWRVELNVTYVTAILDLNSVIALLDAAGLGGVGEWRPSAPKSSTGSFGMFEVVQDAAIPVV